MLKATGLIPTFTALGIANALQQFGEEAIKRQFQILSYVGIKAVAYAKKNHTYRDRTGNLTSSIGYAVVFNGDIQDQYANITMQESLATVQEVAKQNPTGLFLIVVVGMEYAAAVESKGFDVITASSWWANHVGAMLREEIGAVIDSGATLG